ncbi:MAG: glycerol kinase GlpK [Anaerolineaceae bacterium]|nr:glycerol kinase GlpK [Anaerolineaceae bacterium]
MDTRYFMAIDQSTSATKALLFDTSGSLLDAESLPHRQIYPQPGWVEHDAEEIYTNTLRAVSILLNRHQDKWGKLTALSITNQRETFVVFDRASGKPLHHAIVWQCRRGEPTCQRLLDAGHGDLVQQRTGLLLDTYFPASKMHWLLEERPEIRAQVADGGALLGTIDTYLIYRLTGGQVFATEHTNASRTLLFDIHKLDWDADLAALFNVPTSALAEIRASDARFGETDFAGLLPVPLPICGVMGDSQAALFSERCYTPGGVKVTFGSGSSVLMNLGGQPKPAGHGIVTAVAWVVLGQPTYAYEGILNFTGATIQWLRDQLQLIQSADETEALAKSVEDTAGVYLVPAFVGLGAPYWRADARAGILGLTPTATRAHVVRAALESIAYVVHDVLALMKTESGLALDAIHADGGAVRNQFLMQFVADITRSQVQSAQTPELSALGAVLAGMLGMGVYASLEELAQLPAGFKTYSPQMAPGQVDALLTGWNRAVAQVLSRGDVF